MIHFVSSNILMVKQRLTRGMMIKYHVMFFFHNIQLTQECNFGSLVE